MCAVIPVSAPKLCEICASLLIAHLSANAADWPQYRGPTHDGVSKERIVKPWPDGGPPEVWRVLCTNGLSSLAVSGGRVFTQVRRNNGAGDREFCIALDANNGEELWAVDVGVAAYSGGVGDDDVPR